MLQILVLNDDQKHAASFLLRNRSKLRSKYKKYFSLFYQKFDKKIARKYFIPPWFCSEEYISVYDLLRECRKKMINRLQFMYRLRYLIIDLNNSFAMAQMGKINKEKKNMSRDLSLAFKYFEHSAKNNCALGNYYIGKEYLYGRIVKQDFDQAKKYLLKAINYNEVPQAGYYL